MNHKLNKRTALVKKYGEPETLEQLFEIVRLSIEGQNKRDPFVVGLAWSINHRDLVSNTHHAPHNGQTNWQCRDNKARGYPGYLGRVWIRLSERPKKGWVSDYFTNALTYPGSGGAGSYDGPWRNIATQRHQKYGYRHNKNYYPEIICFSWDFRFFDDDWPLITDEWIKNSLFNVIKTSKSTVELSDYREWEDAATAAADKKFIQKQAQAILGKQTEKC